MSILLRDVNGLLAAEKSGMAEQGEYRGSTFSGADIRIGDLLQDEVETEADGSPVTYAVEQATNYPPLYMKLHLHRSVLGAS